MDRVLQFGWYGFARHGCACRFLVMGVLVVCSLWVCYGFSRHGLWVCLLWVCLPWAMGLPPWVWVLLTVVETMGCWVFFFFFVVVVVCVC